MKRRAEEADLLPQWTKRVATDLGGRDPLGLSRVGEDLTGHLLPGIITTTDRARYYALYCWMLWHIEREERPVRGQVFLRAFQRREAAVALATMLADDDASPVGKRVVTRRLAQAREQGEVRMTFQVLPSDPLGGYGQRYGGCLYKLGLTERLEDGIDRVAGDVAEQLALAVHRTLDRTPYLQKRLFGESTIDLKDLQQSCERLSLDAITSRSAAEECKLLIEVFFEFRDGRPKEAAGLRPISLLRILATVAAYEERGIPVGGDRLVEQIVYAPAYFGVLADAKNKTKALKIHDPLRHCSALWRQFCLHQFVTVALEGLLDAMLRVLACHSGGLKLEDTISELLDATFVGYLKRALGRPCRSPRDLLAALQIRGVPDEEGSLDARARYPYDHPFNEWAVGDEVDAPTELAARSCAVLAVLYAKWRGVTSDVTYRIVGEQAGKELAAPSVLPMLDSWFEMRMDWREALRALLTVIIRHHDRVMYEKGRLESCWLRVEDDRIVRDQDYEPYFRSDRHEQAVRILVDLGLLRWNTVAGGRILAMTHEGKDVLRRAMGENA